MSAIAAAAEREARAAAPSGALGLLASFTQAVAGGAAAGGRGGGGLPPALPSPAKPGNLGGMGAGQRR
jgi:hypothetical protein